jgi:polysaccharide export outer membrane protein
MKILNVFAVLMITSLALGLPTAAVAADNEAAVPAAIPLVQPSPEDLLAQVVEDYRIGPSDLIEISVFQVPELSRTVRVNASGAMTLPLVGQIQAGGLTGQQLEVLLAQKLQETYLQNPQVSVFIKEYVSQRVTVGGSVAKPGVFPISGKTTLLQTIAMAGGLGKFAIEDDVRIFRTLQDGSREVKIFDLEPIRKGEAPDPQVLTSDVIVVGKSVVRERVRDFAEFMADIAIIGTLF